MWSPNLNPKKAAELLERYLSDSSEYPQEWNDFIDTSQTDPLVESFRKRCKELETLVNREGKIDAAAMAELKSIIETLKVHP